jgi:hypothetical protein
MLDACRFSALSQRGKPPADPVNGVGQKFGRRRVGALKPVGELVGIVRL